MPRIDLNDAGPQTKLIPVPHNIYRLRARLMAGGAGSEGLLTASKNNAARLMLKLQCRIIGGPYHGRSVFDYPTVEIDEGAYLMPPKEADLEDLRYAVKMGLSRLKAMLQSARNIAPDDNSDEAKAKLGFDSYTELDGLEFWAEVKEKAASKDYEASNQIGWIIVPGDPRYPPGGTGTTPVPQKDLRNGMSDEIPF
jgi:hypothetical protein